MEQSLEYLWYLGGCVKRWCILKQITKGRDSTLPITRSMSNTSHTQETFVNAEVEWLKEWKGKQNQIWLITRKTVNHDTILGLVFSTIVLTENLLRPDSYFFVHAGIHMLEVGESPSLGLIQLGSLSSNLLGSIYLIYPELGLQVSSTNPLGFAFYTSTRTKPGPHAHMGSALQTEKSSPVSDSHSKWSLMLLS